MTTPPDPTDLLTATPPQQPAASPTEAALLEWAATHPAPPTPAVQKNKRGQYHAPPPAGGKAKGHTRVTTYAGTLDDGAGLTVWRNRLLARGVASSDALVKAVRNAGDDNKAVGRAVDQALHEAGEKLKADIGTAMHTAVEHGIQATDAPPPPSPYDADQAAAVAALNAAGLEVALIERCVYVPHGGNLVGRCDLMVRGPWGDELRCLDTKTGSSAERLATAIQLWMYAHATHQWTDGDEWAPLPAIDTTTGYVLHLPAGTGTARILEVDLGAVDDIIPLCDAVRSWRRTAAISALFSEVDTEVPLPMDAATTATVAPAADDRTAWMVSRIRTLPKGEPRDTLARRWPASVPVKPPWTDAHVDTLEPLVAALEPTFGPPDPATPPPEPLPPLPEPVQHPPAGPADPAAEADAVARWQALTEAQQATVRQWAIDAKLAGHPFNVAAADRTERHVACARAAAACAAALWDDDNPAALPAAVIGHITGRPLSAGRFGGTVGALATDEANEVTTLADAFQASDDQAMATVGRLAQQLGTLPS